MAHGATALGYKHDSDQFPILYEGCNVRIYKNHCDEIFIENIDSEVTMRLSASQDGLEFTTDSRVEPIRVTNMIGWLISPRS